MFRAFWLFSFIAIALFAESRVELIAANVKSEGNVTIAEGDVSLRGENGDYMRADRMIYCQDTGEAELFGNVYFSRPGGDLMLADYIKLRDVDRRSGNVDHFFTISNQGQIWLAGNEASVEGNISIIRKGSVSGCAPASPDWSFRFQQAKHDQEKQWVELSHAVFYAGRVPIFYMPFFGYYTDNKRHSGFLFPRFGSSKKEGALFEIPFYIAEMDQWDLEFWDQARYKRGDGLGLYFRWVDSPYSNGSINLGKFKEKEEYEIANKDDRQVKQGGDLLYERTRLFTSASSALQEGLLIDYQDYNDIEYVDLHSLDSSKLNRDISAIVTNKADYFLKGDSAYLGVYSRYFKDFKKPDNNDRLAQILPEAHASLFTRSLYFDNLLYDVDFRARNFTRKEGSKAQDYTISIPIGYHFSLFDDYLLLSARLDSSRYQIDYFDQIGSANLERGRRDRQTFTLDLSTLLAKPYENAFHTIGFGTSLSDPFYYKSDGDFVEVADESASKRTASLYLTQFLYDKKGSAILTHRLNQSAKIEDGTTWLNMENEIVANFLRQRLSVRTIYSHEYGAVTLNTTGLSGSLGAIDYSLTRLYEYDGEKTTKRYLKGSLGYDIDSRNRIVGEYQRDQLENADRGWRAALAHKSGCWNAELSFERTITPYNAGGGSSSKTDDTIYLRLILAPFGDVNQKLYSKERT
ncbi:MAG: hypothetical protein LBP89_09905 [Helicobacteraceae bacterium]|jgi:LPS-assembly protein|nr:hypothetical protein [Helicobacteraceae bacterium]